MAHSRQSRATTRKKDIRFMANAFLPGFSFLFIISIDRSIRCFRKKPKKSYFKSKYCNLSLAFFVFLFYTMHKWINVVQFGAITHKNEEMG